MRAPRLMCGLIRAGAVAILAVSTTWPAEATAGPYPDISSFRPVPSLATYVVVGEPGVWLTTPLGLRCGIADDGSFGCSGNLPGTSAGDEVGWFAGDPFPRLYHVDGRSYRFSSPASQAILPRLSYLAYRGSRCGITEASGIYCIHGDDQDSQIMVTSSTVYRGAAALPAGA